MPESVIFFDLDDTLIKTKFVQSEEFLHLIAKAEVAEKEAGYNFDIASGRAKILAECSLIEIPDIDDKVELLIRLYEEEVLHSTGGKVHFHIVITTFCGIPHTAQLCLDRIAERARELGHEDIAGKIQQIPIIWGQANYKLPLPLNNDFMQRCNWYHIPYSTTFCFDFGDTFNQIASLGLPTKLEGRKKPEEMKMNRMFRKIDGKSAQMAAACELLGIKEAIWFLVDDDECNLLQAKRLGIKTLQAKMGNIPKDSFKFIKELSSTEKPKRFYVYKDDFSIYTKLLVGRRQMKEQLLSRQ